MIDRYEKAYDDYNIILVKALADRLAEVILCHSSVDMLQRVMSVMSLLRNVVSRLCNK